MAVTLTNALTYVRSLLDEPTGTLSPMWSDLELTNWINEACAETQRRVEWKQATASIPVTSNTQYYAAPPNLLRIHRVTFVQNYPGTTESQEEKKTGLPPTRQKASRLARKPLRLRRCAR